VPINGKGDVQKIAQAELGVKWSLKKFSLMSTLFWSELKNIGLSNFEFDSDTNSVFYTPLQFNTSRVFGLEWESVYSPIRNFTFRFDGILQNPKATNWKVYDAASSVETNDDSIIDFSGNAIPFNPKLMCNINGGFKKGDLTLFLKWQFIGEREGNVENAFQLPAYSIFNGGMGYTINKNWSVNLLVTNLFNSEGLANFFGANTFGASANGVTKEYIVGNPDASFVVVPVLPRGTLLKLNYLF
jgi:iron complex outermembrane receptor protein